MATSTFVETLVVGDNAFIRFNNANATTEAGSQWTQGLLDSNYTISASNNLTNNALLSIDNSGNTDIVGNLDVQGTISGTATVSLENAVINGSLTSIGTSTIAVGAKQLNISAQHARNIATQNGGGIVDNNDDTYTVTLASSIIGNTTVEWGASGEVVNLNLQVEGSTFNNKVVEATIMNLTEFMFSETTGSPVATTSSSMAFVVVPRDQLNDAGLIVRAGVAGTTEDIYLNFKENGVFSAWKTNMGIIITDASYAVLKSNNALEISADTDISMYGDNIDMYGYVNLNQTLYVTSDIEGFANEINLVASNDLTLTSDNGAVKLTAATDDISTVSVNLFLESSVSTEITCASGGHILSSTLAGTNTVRADQGSVLLQTVTSGNVDISAKENFDASANSINFHTSQGTNLTSDDSILFSASSDINFTADNSLTTLSDTVNFTANNSLTTLSNTVVMTASDMLDTLSHGKTTIVSNYECDDTSNDQGLLLQNNFNNIGFLKITAGTEASGNNIEIRNNAVRFNQTRRNDVTTQMRGPVNDNILLATGLVEKVVNNISVLKWAANVATCVLTQTPDDNPIGVGQNVKIVSQIGDYNGIFQISKVLSTTEFTFYFPSNTALPLVTSGANTMIRDFEAVGVLRAADNTVSNNYSTMGGKYQLDVKGNQRTQGAMFVEGPTDTDLFKIQAQVTNQIDNVVQIALDQTVDSSNNYTGYTYLSKPFVTDNSGNYYMPHVGQKVSLTDTSGNVNISSVVTGVYLESSDPFYTFSSANNIDVSGNIAVREIILENVNISNTPTADSNAYKLNVLGDQHLIGNLLIDNGNLNVNSNNNTPLFTVATTPAQIYNYFDVNDISGNGAAVHVILQNDQFSPILENLAVGQSFTIDNAPYIGTYVIDTVVNNYTFTYLSTATGPVTIVENPVIRRDIAAQAVGVSLAPNTLGNNVAPNTYVVDVIGNQRVVGNFLAGSLNSNALNVNSVTESITDLSGYAIASIANYSGVLVTATYNLAPTGTPVAVGQIVTIADASSYDGTFVISWIDPTDSLIFGYQSTVGDASGFVGIGTANRSQFINDAVGISCAPDTTGTYQLDVLGNQRVTGDLLVTGMITNTSDKTFKKDIVTIESFEAMQLIQRMRPVRYNWNVEEFPEKHFKADRDIGFIAQEVKDVLPELVKGETGNMSIDYIKTVAVLTGAIQYLFEKLAELEKK